MAQGSRTDLVNTPNAAIVPIDVAPALALHDGALAYTTGDIEHGLRLHRLALAGGHETTLAARRADRGARVWAGDDLAWIEDADLHTDGIAAGFETADYYTDTKLMLLPNGSGSPREVIDGAFSLAASARWVA